jgi:hypothetical protein
MSIKFLRSYLAAAAAAAGALSVFFDKYATISGTDYTTDTAANGTVTAVSDAAEIKHTSEAGSYADLQSVATYKVPFFALLSCKFDAGAAISLRRFGFADADWSDGIFIRMDGTTYKFVVKTGGTESTYTITDDLTVYTEWIIHATSDSVKLYLTETLKTTISTNIPTGNLYYRGKGEKQ